MNEKFLELAKQAGLKFPSETALSPMEEKFAELIVRECANFVDESIGDGGIDGRSLKEHFGVE
jgi:hypothetical protein